MTSPWFAAPVAIVGAAAAVVPAAEVNPSDAGLHCGRLAATGESRCFDSFADELAWAGYPDEPAGYTFDDFVRSLRNPAGVTGRSLPSGVMYALTDGDGGAGTFTHWGSTCPATAQSLAGFAIDDEADGVVNGNCGTVKIFDRWSGSACDTSTYLGKVEGGYGHETALGAALDDLTSCVVAGA